MKSKSVCQVEIIISMTANYNDCFYLQKYVDNPFQYTQPLVLLDEQPSHIYESQGNFMRSIFYGRRILWRTKIVPDRKKKLTFKLFFIFSSDILKSLEISLQSW